MKKELILVMTLVAVLTGGCSGGKAEGKDNPVLTDQSELEETDVPAVESDVSGNEPETSSKEIIASQAFVKQLTIGESITVPPINDGDAGSALELCFDVDEEYGIGRAYMDFNGNHTDIGEFSSMGYAYILGLEDGRLFAILDADYMSDDYVTFLYEITPNGLVKTDEMDGASLLDGKAEPQGVVLSVHLDVLGSYQSLMEYRIDEAGRMKQQDELFVISQSGFPYTILTTVRELPVTVDGQEAVLKPGTQIKITATDNESLAYYRCEDDGTEGEIRFTRGNEEGNMWIIFIDGIPDYEYFESLPYAG